MEMIQTLNAQMAMMMFFALMPMLGMLHARRAQASDRTTTRRTIGLHGLDSASTESFPTRESTSGWHSGCPVGDDDVLRADADGRHVACPTCPGL